MIRSNLEFHSKRPSLTSSSTDKIESATSISSIVATKTNLQPTKLPDDFKPRDKDILCGRGRGIFGHVGNRRFKKLIEAYANDYITAKNKVDKGVVVASLVDSIRGEGILFVKKDAKAQCWYDIGEYQARDKTSHAIRDYMSKSSIRSNHPKPMKIIKGVTTTPIKSQTGEAQAKHIETRQQSTAFTSFFIEPMQQRNYEHLDEQGQAQQTDQMFSSMSDFANPLRCKKTTVPKRISDDTIANSDIFHQVCLDYLSIPSPLEFAPQAFTSMIHQKTKQEMETPIPYRQGEVHEHDIQAEEENVLSTPVHEEKVALQWSPYDEEDVFQWSEFFPVF